MTSPSTSPMTTTEDLAAVQAAVRDYIEGWYAGDVVRMDRALHHDLAKRIPQEDGERGLRSVTKERMLALTADGGGDMDDPAYEMAVDEVAGDIASVRLVSPEYVDFLHLAKTEDGWSIVSVLFHMRD